MKKLSKNQNRTLEALQATRGEVVTVLTGNLPPGHDVPHCTRTTLQAVMGLFGRGLISITRTYWRGADVRITTAGMKLDTATGETNRWTSK